MMATHIVGGEMNYRCLGNDEYEVSLTIFRDCATGVAWFDNPAVVGIFEGTTNNYLFSKFIDLNHQSNDTLKIYPQDTCFNGESGACIHETIYTDTVLLPMNGKGYTLTYQRCCRNHDIVNIVLPEDAGATYWTYISPVALQGCNNSAVFPDRPLIYLYAGLPLNINHQAVDVDGDSLVYELCTPFDGGTPSNSAPNPPSTPPYSNITWQPPYALTTMLGTIDPLEINAATGLITGTPHNMGVFLIGVCVKEYRNGQLMSITRRDFQHIVGPCRPRIIEPLLCEHPVVYVPNAFSPDGDGYNDVLMVNSNNIRDMTLAIYNRWGEKVFESQDPTIGWDGTFKGVSLPPDIYGYYMRCNCREGGSLFLKGNITLLR